MNPDRTICRICRSSDGLLLDIFGSVAQKVTYFEDIDTCLSLKVRKDDGLPQVICVKCAGKLSECTPYVNKVRLLHCQYKHRRSCALSEICSHCGENGNYLFEIPQESLSKVETCFELQVPEKEHICHCCQFHLETLYELHVKSRDTQENFLNKKSPWQEAHNQQEETVGSMVKSLSKKFLSKMKKGKSSSRASNIGSVKSIAYESCSEVSSTVRDESSDSDEDLPLASIRCSSSSKKDAVISNLEPSKLKRRSSSENGNHDTDSEISLKRSKQSAHPKHRRYEDNQDALQKRSPKSSPTKLVVSEKNDAQVFNNSSLDGGIWKKESHRASLGKRTHSGMNNSHDSSFTKDADTEHGTSSRGTDSVLRLPQNKNARISLIDVCKCLGADFFSKGPVNATEFSKLMSSNAPTKRVHWAKDVGDTFMSARGKRVQLSAESKTDVSKETEHAEKKSAPARKSGSQRNEKTERAEKISAPARKSGSQRNEKTEHAEKISAPARKSGSQRNEKTEHAEKISAPAHKSGSLKNENKSSKSSNNEKKSTKPNEALKKKASTREEAKDNSEKDEGTTSTNDHVQLSEDKENENPPRSKPRRSASKIVSYKDMFDDDNYDGDKQSDESDLERGKISSSKNDRIKQAIPPYLKNFDMGDTPKKVYRPFICPMCHAGYISTVKGLLHKLMEHDPRSNFTVQLTRCDSDETFTSTSRQNQGDAIDVTPPKKRKEPSEPGIKEKSPTKRGRPRKHVVVIDQERCDAPEAADNSLSIASLDINATNSCKILQTDSNASKTIQDLENDSLVADDNVVNGDKVPAISAETHVRDPDDNVRDDSEVSDSEENNCIVEAHSTQQVDGSDTLSLTTSKEKRSEIVEKSSEENSLVTDSISQSEAAPGENSLDNDKPADERSEETHESSTKPCGASEKAIKRITQEDTSEVFDALTISVSDKNDTNDKNSEDGSEKNVEGSSNIPTEKVSDKDSEVDVNSNTDSQENADEAPGDDENEASVKRADEDSMKDSDNDSVKGANEDDMKDTDEDSVKAAGEASVKIADKDSDTCADEDSMQDRDNDSVKGANEDSMKDSDNDSVKGANEDDMKDTDEDSVKAAGEASVKIADKDSATCSIKDSEKDIDDDSEKSGDEDSEDKDSQTLKGSVNESCAGDGKTLEDGANKVIEAAGIDTTVECADETLEDDIDQTSMESAKKSLEDIVDEVTEEVPTQVPEGLFGRDMDVLNAC